MLKLIPALEASFDSVINYYESFNGDDKDIENPLVIYVRHGEEKYFRTLICHINKGNNFMFYLIDDENPNYIIGVSNICNPSINYHSSFFDFGCLSYGIRPNERNKGYGNKILSLLLDECKKIGLSEVCVSCIKDNEASKRIIEANGGIFEYEYFNINVLKDANKYWIKLLDKNKKEGRVLCKTLPYKGIRKNH